MSVVLEEVKKRPRLVNSLLKDELLDVAKALEIDITRTARKAEVKAEVIESLVKKGLVLASAVSEDDEDKEEEGEEGKAQIFDKSMREIELEKENELHVRLSEAELKYRFELEKEKLNIQVKLKELEVKLAESQKQKVDSASATKFDIAKNSLVTPFSEDCVDKYFSHLEKITSEQR